MTLAPMLVSRTARIALLWGPLGCMSLVMAADELQPDPEFLEYLGSWAESDEDWLLFSEEVEPIVVIDSGKEIDSTPKGEDSTESKDES